LLTEAADEDRDVMDFAHALLSQRLKSRGALVVRHASLAGSADPIGVTRMVDGFTRVAVRSFSKHDSSSRLSCARL
jgi:hypothetical protein